MSFTVSMLWFIGSAVVILAVLGLGTMAAAGMMPWQRSVQDRENVIPGDLDEGRHAARASDRESELAASRAGDR